eukprot:6207793-Pleurochrysis_carterae.AAC.1
MCACFLRLGAFTRVLARPLRPSRRCVYEWAALLATRDPLDVRLCVETFMRPATRRLYVQVVRGFSVARAKCFVEADRAVLHKKIDEYYYSVAMFETFVRATACALLCLSATRCACRSEAHFAEEFTPWVLLAQELGMHELSQRLGSADPIQWRRDAVSAHDGLNVIGKEARKWWPAYNESVDVWFTQQVVPVLHKIKTQAVRGDVLLTKSVLSSKLGSFRTPQAQLREGASR